MERNFEELLREVDTLIALDAECCKLIINSIVSHSAANKSENKTKQKITRSKCHRKVSNYMVEKKAIDKKLTANIWWSKIKKKKNGDILCWWTKNQVQTNYKQSYLSWKYWLFASAFLGVTLLSTVLPRENFSVFYPLGLYWSAAGEVDKDVKSHRTGLGTWPSMLLPFSPWELYLSFYQVHLVLSPAPED